MSLTDTLVSQPEVFVRQRHELGEFFGFETRNKYEILTKAGQSAGFAAEQQKGFLGFILRQFLGHWRSFEIHVYDEQRQEVLLVKHPFRWYFERLEVYKKTGELLGSLERRFSILSKSFDVHGADEKLLMTVRSPIWRIWTFRFMRREKEVAIIEKKWSGLFSEAITDRDNFRVGFTPELNVVERALILCAALFVDLRYFERKAR
jgi:hypothetical protein